MKYIPLSYRLKNNFNIPGVYPFNYTLAITQKCNSKCKTCNIWSSKAKDLRTEQWHDILKKLGKLPLWITISGGEPFLRKDVDDIIRMILTYNKPKFLNIPTNGIETKRIYKTLSQFQYNQKNTKLIVNFSLDSIGGDHDNIRGVKCFDKLNRSIKMTKELGYHVGIHTVISQYNHNHLEDIIRYVKKLNVDSHVFELAQIRSEFDNKNIAESIMINNEDAKIALRRIDEAKLDIHSKTIGFFRKRYYENIYRSLNGNKRKSRCYAGVSSCYVSNDGSVYRCPVKKEKLGNLLRDDLKDIFVEQCKNVCDCTMANVFYSNYLSRKL